MSYADYFDIQDEGAHRARAQEYEAMNRSITLLETARMAGANSREQVDALRYLDRLWSILLDDLAHADNQLPPKLRAGLISVGLWILREVEQIRQGASQNLKGLIEVSAMICSGLEAQG